MKYDIKIYEEKTPPETPTGLPQMEEMETIRDLTETQKTCIVAVFERHIIKHLVKEVEKR